MRIIIAAWHKWLALLVAIQLLIWLGTGLYFNSLMDSASNITTEQPVQHEAYLPGLQLFPLQELPAPPPLSIKLIWILGTPYYALHYNQPLHDYFKQERRLFDAVSGKPWQITPRHVSRIADLAYTGNGLAAEPELVMPPIADLPRQQNPLWRINFADEVHTSLYLDAQTGHVIKHTNDHQRFDDLMFTLHFMDYAGSGSFNHWLIIITAAITCLLSVTGGYLLLKSGIRSKPGNLSASHAITITRTTRQPETIFTSSSSSLFAALAKQNIHLPSECGGGGTCGKCRVQVAPDSPVSEAEHYHLNTEQLAKGYRLGCQQQAGHCNAIHIP